MILKMTLKMGVIKYMVIKTDLAFISDLDEEPLQENVHRIITHEFPRYFALVSRPKVEYGMVGPTGGLLTVKAVDKEAIATFPEQG